MSSLLLKIKKATAVATTFDHVAFASGENAGKFVGVKENGKFYVLIEATTRRGADFQKRKAVLNINPEIGLSPEDFEAGLSGEETTELINSLFGKGAKIVLEESFVPQYEGQEPGLDKNGDVLMKFNVPVYRSTRLAEVTAVDVLVQEPTTSAIDAESAY